MKHPLQVFILSACLFFPFLVNGQSPTVCPINAGPDQTICTPNCATLTGTFVPTNATTSYAMSTVPYTPDPFTAGTSINVSDDQWSPLIPLPFTFCFYGTAYNNIVIGSNGILSFNAAYANGYCQWPIPAAYPSASDPVNSIGGPWQDLYPPGGGTIKYITYGAAPCRRFVVSWNGIGMYGCFSTLCTQQLILYETTNIIDNFIQSKPQCPSWNGGYAIQGIQNQAASSAFVQPGRNYPTVWSANNDGKRWTPSGANTYQIGWYQGATLISNTASTVVCPTNTLTYTFQAVYTNCNNTTVTVQDNMIVFVSQLVTTAGPDQTICNGGCATLTGNAVGATSYSWAVIPGNIPAGNTATIVPCPTVTTTYVVTAQSPSCAGTDTVVVNVTNMSTASAGPDDSVCVGNCTTLQGSGGVSYSWAPAAAITGPANIANPQACPTVTTVYTVTVTDANGCIGTDQCTVYVAPTVLSLNITPTNPSCFGYCNGSATSAPVGGFPPYTYAWSNGQTTANGTGFCSGAISLTVTDAIGCTATATATLVQPTAVQIVATSITNANCGQSDGTVTISVSGGTPGPGYTIVWPATGNSGLTEINLPPGQVCVYAYDANGCGDTLCVIVPNTPGATVNIVSFTNVTCNGACDGTAVAGAVGGTAPYSYVWNTTPLNQANDTAFNLCPGTYTVTMTDANGCTANTTVTITEPPLLTNVAGTATTICIGQSANLTDVAAGGTSPYMYSWTDGTNNWATANISVSPTVTTTYTVFVTDANGCVSANQMVTVTVNPPLTVQAMPGITVCANTLVNLTAVANGGNGNYTYTWLPINMNGNSVNTTVVTTTTYSVVVTDNCGTPSDTSVVTVTVNPQPTVLITATTATSGCMPLCVTFTNNTPNTASIAWTFGNNLGTSTAANPTYCFTTNGSYDVSATVTDNIGCIGSTTLTNYVTVYPLPTADFTASPQPATQLNNQVTFTDQSTGAMAWIWSFGADDSASILQNPVYTFQDTGTFNIQLIVTNQYGCQDAVTIPIVVHADYALFIPNTFTPNGDGINDVFFPLGVGVNPDKFVMYIFDRWGNMIFKTDTWPGGWDGTVQNTSRMCQEDTYVYKITTMDPEGTRKVYIGHINLIR
jgi:gliding motility-associated-like protein